jgi:NAD(P)-dependent dehydrogenase (short-subunit alcohol dehydrogenase family)
MASLALIVGASRGLGLGLVREYLSRDWHVIATVRDAHRLSPSPRLEIERLDVTAPDELHALRDRLRNRTLDLLLVNAGIANDPAATLAATSAAEFTRIMLTNAYGPMCTIEAFADLVRPDGVIAVMSSGLGSVADNTSGGREVYRASKAALNMLMRSYSAREKSRTLLTLAPGWVRTDMGGPAAPLDVETSVRGLADVIAARRGTPCLAFLDYKGETLPW